MWSYYRDLDKDNLSPYDRNVFHKSFSTCISSREEWSENKIVSPGILEVYTDGSKTDEGIGSGIFRQGRSIQDSFGLRRRCTVFQCKMAAIKKASILLLNSHTHREDITIFVGDHQTMVLETIEALLPGHENYLDIEKADELARAGSLRIYWNTEWTRSNAYIFVLAGKDHMNY